jgi:hypothetical protein
MTPLFRKKIRWLTLVSLVLVTQCCCCILPLRWQVQQQQPAIRQEILRIEQFSPLSSFHLPGRGVEIVLRNR